MDDMPDFEQIGKIINAVKTAKLLSEAMQGNDSGEVKRQEQTEAKTGDLDLSAILSPSSSSGEGLSQDLDLSQASREPVICAFDRELQSPAIRSIKAAIPYLEERYQRNMGIAVKLMELDRLLNHYTVLAAEKGGDKTREMLLAVKSELPPKNQFAADLLIKILEIRDITAAAVI